jgi:hypothetical protein
VLLNHLNITTHPEFRIKRVPCPRWEEYKAIVEIFSGLIVLSRHKGPCFRAMYQDAVADAAWKEITTYNHRYHVKDWRRRPEGGEWEPIKILRGNLVYILESTRRPSLLTRPRSYNYNDAIGPRNRVRNRCGNTNRCYQEHVRDWR